MQLKRCSAGIFSACILFLISAAFFDNPGLLFISCSLGLFLLFRYILFFHSIQNLSSTFRITRTIERNIIRQNHQVRVDIAIQIINGKDISLLYREKQTKGCRIEKGILECSLSENENNISTLTYWLTPFIHGNIRFAGGELIFSDHFFSFVLSLSEKSFTDPELNILPLPRFEKEENISSFGGVEIDKLRLLHGVGVRSFREYLPGDDYRIIDWKLTAKHDTLYVREYAGIQNKPPLIIIDLPEADTGEDYDNFNRIIRAITGIIDTTLEKGLNISILAISGPNVIDMLIEECDWSKCMDLIRRKFHPEIRLHHLYRIKQRAEIRHEIKRLSELKTQPTEESGHQYYEKKSRVLLKILLDSGVTHFSSQITRILDHISPDEIHLYSLCEGDISHINEIILQSKYKKIRFCLKTPLAESPLRIAKTSSIIRSEKIEGVE